MLLPGTSSGNVPTRRHVMNYPLAKYNTFHIIYELYTVYLIIELKRIFQYRNIQRTCTLGSLVSALFLDRRRPNLLLGV